MTTISNMQASDWGRRSHESVLRCGSLTKLAKRRQGTDCVAMPLCDACAFVREFASPRGGPRFHYRGKREVSMFRTALTLFMSSLAIPAVASMRCGTHLVDEGDSVEQVLERCGQPLSRIVNEPALRNNGVPKLNAARTEFWVYGPSGGVYRHLRFIDGKLVEIRLERK